MKKGVSEMKPAYNTNTQYYKDIPIRLIVRGDYHVKNAKRFIINNTNQNVWIPNKHLEEDGTIKAGENIDYVFIKSHRQCKIAGVNLNACLTGVANYGRRLSL